VSEGPCAGGCESGEIADDAQWIIAAAQPGACVRFSAPADAPDCGSDVWVEVRALTYREALERESLGVVEDYELDENGRALCVSRRYDLWAMAAYDLERSLVDFCLPEWQADGTVVMRRKGDGGIDGDLAALETMPPALAEWVQGCIDRVNLRHFAGQSALAEAKKNCEDSKATEA